MALIDRIVSMSRRTRGLAALAVAACALMPGAIVTDAADRPSSRPSYYPVEPKDPMAVYLRAGEFPVHADGKGDDAPALQAAIDRVEATTSTGIVFVPEGTYRLGRMVIVYRGIRLIGYGKRKPVFLLGGKTPGYQEGEGKYMLYFAHRRTKPGEPPEDGTEATLFSGLSNIDIIIEAGNEAAIAVRAHWAQQSALEHIDFHVGSARGAVEELGHEVEDCRFFGGEFAIRTAIPTAGWQCSVYDSEFEGQRGAAIETREAGMSVYRSRFRNVPYGIRIPLMRRSHLTGESTDRVFVKDSRFENVTESAIWVARYHDPKTQINVEQVECANTPTFLSFAPFPGAESTIAPEFSRVAAPEAKAGTAATYAISLSHGLHVTVGTSKDVERKLQTTILAKREIVSLGPIPAKDFRDLPPRESWVNVKDLGAVGDGRSDDTAAFKKAIAEHKAVYVPMGSYRLTDTLELGRDTALIGLHCAQTRFTLAPSTQGFTDPASPKPLLLAPTGTSPIVSGIGTNTDNPNRGAVAIKWMAGPRSFIDDVHLRTARTVTGDEQLYGLWVTDGGGGVIKSLWAPNESATLGLYVTDTSTPSAVYQTSIEHHFVKEIVLKNVQNWTFYTLQTEEVSRNEHTQAIEIDGCRNLTFVNLYLYHSSGTNMPAPHGIKVLGSGGLLFRGLHNFSGGPFPFDATLVDIDSGAVVRHPELARLSIR